jgi:aspartyl-tRNA(Asn)/glutamyl-tRNA(Gln) amidotransferase subunit A
MNDEWITHLSGAELSRLIRAKELSPVELMKGYLDRIGRYDSALKGYITICDKHALSEAKLIEDKITRGKALGPLSGLPLAVKDQFDTVGIRTTAGSSILADYIPTEDATLISRARAAGTILLGKLNMTEFAAGQGDPFKYGDPARNPWDATRYPGSSSTGSGIAIAASLCAIALGEDTGGSIRAPASFCGIVGLRPTWGLFSRAGLWPISWSMDAAGPMTKTVEDAALLTTALSGHDPRDPQTSRRPSIDYAKNLKHGIEGLRVGIIKEFFETGYIDSEVRQAFLRACEELKILGATVEEVSFPLGLETGPLMDAIAINDAGYLHRQWLTSHPQHYGRNLRRRFLSSGLLPAHLRQKAMRVRALLRRDWLDLFQQFDILLTPTASTVAPPIFYDSPVQTLKESIRRFTARPGATPIAALSGTPALSVPCGFNKKGLPIGLQIMADRFREDLVFQVGHAYEQATIWHKKRPALDTVIKHIDD